MSFSTVSTTGKLNLAASQLRPIIDEACKRVLTRIASLAANITKVPFGLICLPDGQFFAWPGESLEFSQVELKAFYPHTTLEPEIVIVPDTWQDARFAANPLVSGPPYIRFYAAIPLHTSNNNNNEANFCTLFLADHQPHQLDTGQRQCLSDLAALASELLEGHLAAQDFQPAPESITPPQLIENNLKKGEEQQRTLARNIPNSIVYMFDQDLRFIFAEGSILSRESMGFSKQDLEGKTLWEALPADEAAELAPLYKRALAGKETVYEKNYGNRNYHIHILPARDENGDIYAGLILVQDNTERDRTEQHLKLVIRNAPIVLYTFDTKGKVTLAEGKGLDAIGVRPGQAIGTSIFSIFKDDPQYQQDFNRLLAGEVTNRLVEYNGQVLEAYCTPVKNQSGEVTSIIAVCINITEKRTAENDLQAARDLGLQVMGNMGQGLIVFKPGFITEFVNSAFCKMSGYSREELVNIAPLELVPTNFYTRIVELSQGLGSSDGESRLYETELLRKDGTLFTAQISLAPIFNAGKLARIVGVVTDLTEQKKIEQQLRRALEKEKELSEMKTRLIATTSHEFRTPLSAIISSAELLEFYSQRWSEEKKKEILGRIGQAALRLTALIENILIYNRAEEGKLGFTRARVNLPVICQGLVNDYKVNAAGSLTIKFVEIGERQETYLDEKLLNYILNSLLSNAVKYSKPGGNVTLELEWQPEEVVVRVIDEGIGIPLKDQANLFEPFQRASNVGNINGTGFGLAIVKQSVLAHNGRIWLQSQEDCGTTFTVALPLQDDSNCKDQPEAGPESDGLNGAEKKLERLENTWWILEQAIEASSSGIIISDPTQEDNPIIHVNKGFERLTGFLREEVIGKNGRFLEGADHDQPGLKELYQALAEERECRVVLRNYHKDGHLLWIELQLSPVRNQAGKVIYYVGIQTDVSDRVRAETALNQSEQKFKALVENLPDVIARYDRDARHLYMNPTLERITGGNISVEKVIGQIFPESLYYTDAEGGFKTQLNKVFETKEAVTFELIPRSSQISPEIHQVRMVPEFSSDGKEVVSVLTIGRDITELKRTNEALHASESRLNEILQSITDGFFSLDSDWHFTYINPQAEKFLQRDKEKLLGQYFWDLFPPLEGSLFPHMYESAMNERVAVNFEEYYAPLDTWFGIHLYPLTGGLSVYFQDISSRKKADEALKKSEREYRSLMEQAPDAIYICDYSERILEVNEACCILTGYSRQELLQMYVYELAPRDLAENRRTPSSLLSSKQPVTGRRKIRRKDGSLVLLDVNIRLIEDNRLVGIARDIYTQGQP